ncbi:hypothetical protein ACX0MV_20090 [Pseudomonas borbori]
MRTLNISIMLGLAGVTAFFGVFMLIANARDLSQAGPLISSLICFSSVSIAYFNLVLKSSKRTVKSQIIILATYAISAASGAAAASSIGLISYVMKSMDLSFIPALDYIWRPALVGGTISITTYVFAHIYSLRKSIELVQAEHQSA